MSALSDKIHSILSHLTGISMTEVEDFVKAAEEHLAPSLVKLRADVVADVEKLVADAKADLLAAITAVSAPVAATGTPAAPATDVPVEEPAAPTEPAA
jgi:predicted transcriptional regulator